MKRLTTTLLLLLLGLCVVPALRAQDPQMVTVRDINAVPQDNVDQLNAAGANLTIPDIESLIFNDLVGETVQFTAVLLTDPRNSGLATPDDQGLPGRVHVYVRDTSAASLGLEGMGIQLVDGAYQTTGLIDLGPGDVITVVGVVSPFGASMQVAPESITFEGTYQDLGLPDSVLDTVSITTADANSSLGDGQVQTNWDNLSSLNGQYVRIEGATVLARDISTDRPNWIISTDGGETVLSFYDMSLRYRNDRSDYDSGTFNVLDDDFVPPPPGSVINLTGTLVFQEDDPFSRATPEGGLLSIVPWEDADLEVTESPPEAATPDKPATVPGADEDVVVTTEATADPSRELTGVTLTYFTSEDPTEMDVSMMNTEDNTWEATIPGQADGVFVIYRATAEDNTGASFTSNDQTYRVLADGIDEIADIQTTYQEEAGDSPFAGMTPAMNLMATVQSDPGTSGLIAIQDNADLDGWTGILVSASEELIADLQRGDVINITSGEIDENFGVTELSNIEYTTVTEGGDPLGYKTVTTDVLQDASIAEAHEGMLLNFDDPVITSTNPDDPIGPFGEWGFSSDGTAENQVRADDSSEAISFTDGDAAEVFTVGERLDFLRGIWWYSFGNYKLLPEDLATDAGEVINTATDDEAVPGSFALEQNYPNPFNPATTISYTVPATGSVRLEVFDLLGRSVAVLVDGQQPAGTYTLQFDGTELASGLYLYRLSAGSKVQTKKMLLLK